MAAPIPSDNQPLHGWIVLDKPVGLGSTQAVSAIKRLLREAGKPKVKVGHGGTLDPLASGVLPIALGEATKLAGRMLDATKAYEFTIRFGEQTDTLDTEGEVIATSGSTAPSSCRALAASFRKSSELACSRVNGPARVRRSIATWPTVPRALAMSRASERI